MKTAYDVILRPIISEKSMMGTSEKKYTFEVHKDANKTEIRQAVETIFGVKVEKVNTMNVDGKVKRQGKYVGRTSSWKKAIVKLAPGSKDIEFFEGI